VVLDKYCVRNSMGIPTTGRIGGSGMKDIQFNYIDWVNASTIEHGISCQYT
jgi:hypothetical protein